MTTRGEETMSDRNEANQQHAPDQDRQPADVLRDGALKATIWRNQGDDGAFYSTSLTRTYEDRDGNPRDAHSFSGGDLLKVSELARKAYDRSAELKREDFKQQRETSRPREQNRGRNR